MNQKQKSEGGIRLFDILRRSHQKSDARDKPSLSFLRAGVCTILAFLLGGCALPFSVYPLGVAFLCAATDCLPFCILGFLVAGFMREAPLWLYPATCILILLCRLLARIFIDMPSRLGEKVNLSSLAAHLRGRIFAESLYLRMTSSCVCVFFLSLVAIVGGGFRYYDLFGALLSIAAAPAAVFLYAGFFGTDGTVGERVGSFLHHAWPVALAASVCLSLKGIPTLGTFLGTAAALACVLAIHKRSGFAAATAAAVLCGISLGIPYVPVLLVVSVSAYCLMDLSSVAAAAVSCLCGSLTGYFLGEHTLFLPLLGGAVLFCSVAKITDTYAISLTPAKPKKAKASTAPPPTNENASFERLSDAFFSLSESFFRLGQHLGKPSGTELKHLCDEAFDEICPICPNRTVCWEEKYTVMKEIVSRLATSIGKTGVLADGDIPSELPALCGLHENVIAEIRTRTAALSRSRLSGERAQIFALDYGATSKIIKQTLEAQKIRTTPNAAAQRAVHERLSVLGFEPLSVTVLGERGKEIHLLLPAPAPDAKRLSYLSEQLRACLDICLSPLQMTEQEDGVLLCCKEAPRVVLKRGSSFAASEGVCGDAVSTFSDAENGYFYALLCDGMGTGLEAALTARLASTFLQKLLTAGVKPETALGMLSDFLRLGRNGGAEESSTTVDLLQLDEYTGKGVFFKCGAAPTYVKRGGSIFKLSANTLPLGILKENREKRIEFDLLDGDVAVIVSDGIGGEEECLWLLDYLGSTEETDPEVIASFLTEAASTHGSRDDLSALVLACRRNT